MDWAAHDHRPKPPAPAQVPDPIAVCWRVIGSHETSRPITCAIYPAPSGRFEVRVEYSALDLIRSQVTRTRQAAEDYAAIWKLEILKTGFTELGCEN